MSTPETRCGSRGDTVTRPDGRVYRSRKVIAHILGDEDEIPCAVLVLGTHDIARAQPLADRVARMYAEPGSVAARPETGWWRESIRDYRRWWVDDDKRGRAGVMFREITESPVTATGGKDISEEGTRDD